MTCHESIVLGIEGAIVHGANYSQHAAIGNFDINTRNKRILEAMENTMFTC